MSQITTDTQDRYCSITASKHNSHNSYSSTQLLQIHITCRSAHTCIDVLVAFVILCLCVGAAQQPSAHALPRLVMAFIATYSYPTNCAQTFYHLLCIANSLDLSMLCRVNSSNIGCCHFKRTPFIGCHRVAARVQIHIKLVNLQKRRRLRNEPSDINCLP